ncbi:MAG TPA: hypothetical protein VFJ30_14530 [Phycisphaerae bacterium]|nr:hypothetical protein [Phycisphaerae bacterium]
MDRGRQPPDEPRPDDRAECTTGPVQPFIPAKHRFIDDDICQKRRVGTVAGLDSHEVAIVRREQGKGHPKYWLERVPASEVRRVAVKTHISVSGVLVGLVAGYCGVFMGMATIKGTITGLGAYTVPLALLAICAGLLLGCRRKKAVFHTDRGSFRWVSAPLEFQRASEHVRTIEAWCDENDVLMERRRR